MSFTVSAMIQGYHVYKEVWNAEVNEELRCEREVGNRNDTFAVAVKKGTVTVGHAPRTISSICSPDGSGRPLFLLSFAFFKGEIL